MSRSSADYDARGGPGDPRGRKSGAGPTVANPILPARAEGGKTAPLTNQEAVGCDAQCGVMVKSAPVAPFEVSEAQLLFQLLIIPFNDPALFGDFDQSFERGIRRQRRDPILRRFRFASRPFDQ